MIKSIKKHFLSFLYWIKKNKKEAVVLGLIILVSAFFRLYRIDEYMTFLGDEGRDAIIVRRLLVDFDLILIGPGTSIGNMYLGPLYYYLMAPFLLLANFSPVGPSVMIAMFSIITTFMIWLFSRRWFGETAAIISSFLYAISPVVINYSRSSWNPNIMPFFALICIYSIWKVWGSGNYKWLILLGISFAFVLQSHYLGLLLLPTIILFFLLSYIRFRNSKLSYAAGPRSAGEIRNFYKNTLISLLIFFVLMSPLLLFDIRHNFINFNAVKVFFTERQTTVSARPWNALPNIWPIFNKDFIQRILGGYNKSYGNILSSTLTFFVIIGGILNIKKIKRLLTDPEKDKSLSSLILISLWLIFGLIGMGLYKQHIYDHYFGFMFPAPFFLVGAISQKVWDKFGDSGKIFVVSGFVFLVTLNLANSPLWSEPNSQLYRATEIAKVIKENSGGEKYNLAVIAERNYEDGYQYILEKWGEPVYDINPEDLDNTLADQLFVVCEYDFKQEEKCDPTHNPKAEIANFGWSKIENKWFTNGVFVYKLVHVEEN